MSGRSGYISNTDRSTHTTQTDTSASNHVTLVNQAFDQEGLFQPGLSNLPNYPVHGKVPYLQKTCAECLILFSTNSNLEQHASNSGHTAFSCTCGAQFSRAYTLTRHINSMVGPSFPCELCDDKTFPRLDKLGDHLRRWHRLGAKAFDQYKGGNSPASTGLLSRGDMPPIGVKDFGQAYPVAPVFEPMSASSAFPPVLNTAFSTSAFEFSTGAGSFTAADNCWFSQPGHNTAYAS